MRVQPEEIIRYWLTSSEDNWKSAQNAFSKRDYVPALFWAHLYLEKRLKAFIVYKTQKQAPYGHGLVALAETAELQLSTEQILLLRRATDYNIESRYPDYKSKLKKKATREYCKTELKEIEAIGKWLKSIVES